MYIVLLKALAKFISSNSESPNNPFWTGINVTPPHYKKIFSENRKKEGKEGFRCNDFYMLAFTTLPSLSEPCNLITIS